MSYEDYEDYEDYKPTEVEGLEKAIAFNVKAAIDVASIQVLIRRHISENYRQLIQQYIQQESIKCIKDAFQSKASFERALHAVMREKLDEAYPGLVDDKIDELAKRIKGFEFNWNDRRQKENMQKVAMEKVDLYIETELASSVKRSTDYVEQFSRNYFANNLFRAMGMMDKMLPQANSDDVVK